MSAAGSRHMERVAGLPCCVCEHMGRPHVYGVQVHHIREGQGAAQRADDILTIPVCSRIGSLARVGLSMRLTAPARLQTWAHASRMQSDEETFDMTWRGEVEDGSGWNGLVPSKAELEQERREVAYKQRIEDLAMLVRRLARALDKPGGNTLLSRQAMDYLKRHGPNAEITR